MLSEEKGSRLVQEQKYVRVFKCKLYQITQIVIKKGYFVS